MHRRAVLAASLIAGATGACRHHHDDRARQTRELRTCVEAIDRAAAAAAADRIDVLARGCAPACPGLGAWADARVARLAPAEQGLDWTEAGSDASAAIDPGLALVRGCNALCGPGSDIAVARAAPGERWPALLTACGPTRYGLSADRLDLASDTWLVLHRVNDWLETMRRAAVDDGQLPALLERATLRALFRLPLPARSAIAGYRLPTSPHGQVSDAVLYAVVADRDVRIGAVPLVRLRGPQLELRRGPGGDFPGQRVDDAQLGAVMAQYATYLEAEVPAAADLPPLLVVDAATPLARVIEIAAHVGAPQVEVAVAGDAALAHAVVLERQTAASAAIPVLRLGAGRVDIVGLSDDRTTDVDKLPDELRHFAAVNAPVRRLSIEASVPATAADLVRILDACADARVDALVFAPPP